MFSEEVIISNLKRLTNQIYKLLPNREEGIDWQIPLQTIIEEFLGMAEILKEQNIELFSLVCKLKGLSQLTEKEDFFLYRRTIFECLGIIQDIEEEISNGRIK